MNNSPDTHSSLLPPSPHSHMRQFRCYEHPKAYCPTLTFSAQPGNFSWVATLVAGDHPSARRFLGGGVVKTFDSVEKRPALKGTRVLFAEQHAGQSWYHLVWCNFMIRNPIRIRVNLTTPRTQIRKLLTNNRFGVVLTQQKMLGWALNLRGPRVK